MEKSPVKRISGEENIPTPFKKALFWPSSENQPTTTNNRKQREKLPSVACSSSWQEYHRNKLKKTETEQRVTEEKNYLKPLKIARKPEMKVRLRKKTASIEN